MKVAQILYSGLGGHGSVAFSLVGGDRDRAWTNAFGFLGVEPLLDEYRARCEANGIGHRYFRAISGRPWARWMDIARWLDAERPDAIVNHSGTALLPCLWHARRRGIPLIHVEHTPLQTKSRGEWVFTELAMVAADAVVMLTDDYAAASRVRLGRRYRDAKVRVIPNGVDTDRFIPARKHIDGRRIGMAARFSPAKRQDMLVDVVAALAHREPAAGWHLTLAGDGSELDRVRDEAARRAAGLVTFEGALGEQALATWLQSLDVYIHGSDGETLSTSLLQAMATGLPIVASDVAGIRNLLLSGTGLLSANGDTVAWADAIAGLIGDPHRARAMGAAARDAVIGRYGNVAMWRSYDALVRRAG